ncbi:unnamed protein product [Lepeophtheirus salmonis]|uniref:(salmon louse) hypothetical protein n=1 Tax=Lepeophtheirus salmonis TaxID=72036 RepID=A0A7R8H621_LEPSM|nr:unnamed protein product [Lepeophtheirus salmonis]CAF2878060.1 unnamed protein product [Lepeophtheirus salmonis]
MDTEIWAPKKFFMDNGWEFSNKEMVEHGENFNIRIRNTSAYSPFSNGLCERKNLILDIIISRLVEDDITDVDVALGWAVAARNYLQNFGEFSPNQDGATKDLNIGDMALYKRNDDSKWKGPGKIIGEDYVKMRKIIVKEDFPMVKINVEARINGIDHGYDQMQTDIEETCNDDDEDYHYGRRQRNVVEARIEDENVIASHIEDVSNSNGEGVSTKHGEITNVQVKIRRGRSRNEEKVIFEKGQNCPMFGENFEAIDLNSGKWFQMVELAKPMEDIEGSIISQTIVLQDDLKNMTMKSEEIHLPVARRIKNGNHVDELKWLDLELHGYKNYFFARESNKCLQTIKKVEDKKLRIEIAMLKEMMERSEIMKVVWVQTKNELANCVTKYGSSTLDLMEVIQTGRIPTNRKDGENVET